MSQLYQCVILSDEPPDFFYAKDLKEVYGRYELINPQLESYTDFEKKYIFAEWLEFSYGVGIHFAAKRVESVVLDALRLANSLCGTLQVNPINQLDDADYENISQTKNELQAAIKELT